MEEEEIKELNRIVSMYLDCAENQANRGKLITMKEWADKLDSFLLFNDHNILKDAGKIRADVAKKFAEKEYEKFRVIQDREYKSDFDKVIEEIKITGSLPKEEIKHVNPLSISSVSNFNKMLKKGLDHNPKENE